VKRKRLLFTAGFILLLLSGGISSSKAVVDRVVAVVNQEIIMFSEVEKWSRSFQEEIQAEDRLERRERIQEVFRKVLEKLIEEKLIDQEVKKFEIKSGKFIAHKEGEPPFEVKIRKLKELSRTCCRVCLDYTSELADLSIGNVGSPDGYSTVLVRTEKGEASLRATEKKGLIEVKPLKDYQPGMSLVDRLSDMKKKENSGKPLDQ